MSAKPNSATPTLSRVNAILTRLSSTVSVSCSITYLACPHCGDWLMSPAARSAWDSPTAHPRCPLGCTSKAARLKSTLLLSSAANDTPPVLASTTGRASPAGERAKPKTNGPSSCEAGRATGVNGPQTRVKVVLGVRTLISASCRLRVPAACTRTCWTLRVGVRTSPTCAILHVNGLIGRLVRLPLGNNRAAVNAHSA